MPGEFSSKRNFLFDLDGTLVDSAGSHARAFVDALSNGHPALARKFDYAAVAGRPTREVFVGLGFEESELTDMTARKQRFYRAALERGEVRLFHGAGELLVGLRSAGRRVFLVTGASRLSAEKILEATGIANHFAGMITAEDAREGKPSPEPYLRALEKYELVADDCLAIEDAESGVRSARGAGVEVVLMQTELVIPGVINVHDCVNFARRVLA